MSSRCGVCGQPGCAKPRGLYTVQIIDPCPAPGMASVVHEMAPIIAHSGPHAVGVIIKQYDFKRNWILTARGDI